MEEPSQNSSFQILAKGQLCEQAFPVDNSQACYANSFLHFL
jgi:hypothetical protein